MKCIKLTAKTTNRHQSAEYLAKLPIIPSLYMVTKQGKNIGLLAKEDENELLLISDSQEFLERYQNYYEARFKKEEMPEDYIVPAGYAVVFGKISFDNEAEPDESLDVEV
jgi:hypothetical protein